MRRNEYVVVSHRPRYKEHYKGPCFNLANRSAVDAFRRGLRVEVYKNGKLISDLKSAA